MLTDQMRMERFAFFCRPSWVAMGGRTKMARTSWLIRAAALCGMMLSSAALAQGFHCPPAGTTITTNTGLVFRWTGSAPDNSVLCLAQYGNNSPPYWSYALLPAWDELSAAVDINGVKNFFPLHPGEPINLNYRRTFEGSEHPFVVVGIVEQGPPMVVSGMTRQVLVINAHSPDAGPGALGAAGPGLRARFVIDQLTNALLAVDLTEAEGRIGPASIHWKATSLQLP